jgi:hypothetical protein
LPVFTGSASACALAVALLVAGCSGGGHHGTVVRETFEAAQTPHRFVGSGRASVGCELAATYTVREATGTAYLTQTKLVLLGLPGPRYRVECRGPLVAELPVAATRLEAPGRVRMAKSIPVGPRRTLGPQPGAKLALVDWPKDARKLELKFELPGKPRLVRERIAYTASVACGGAGYLVPLMPLGQGLGFVNAYSVPRNGKPFAFVLPRLAGGAASNATASLSLACR